MHRRRFFSIQMHLDDIAPLLSLSVTGELEHSILASGCGAPGGHSVQPESLTCSQPQHKTFGRFCGSDEEEWFRDDPVSEARQPRRVDTGLYCASSLVLQFINVFLAIGPKLFSLLHSCIFSIMVE